MKHLMIFVLLQHDGGRGFQSLWFENNGKMPNQIFLTTVGRNLEAVGNIEQI